jgi:hypothetical protein
MFRYWKIISIIVLSLLFIAEAYYSSHMSNYNVGLINNLYVTSSVYDLFQWLFSHDRNFAEVPNTLQGLDLHHAVFTHFAQPSGQFWYVTTADLVDYIFQGRIPTDTVLNLLHYTIYYITP